MATGNDNKESNHMDDNITLLIPESGGLVEEIFVLEAVNDVNHHQNVEVAENVISNSSGVNSGTASRSGSKLNKLVRDLEKDIDDAVNEAPVPQEINFARIKDIFTGIFNSLIEDGITFERIIIFIAFAYRWFVKNCPFLGSLVMNVMDLVKHFLGIDKVVAFFNRNINSLRQLLNSD